MPNRLQNHDLRNKPQRRTVVRLFGMLLGSNMAASRARSAAVISITLLIATAGYAQPTPTEDEEPPTLSAPLVDWSHGLRVHRHVENWVRDGVPDEPDQKLRVTGARGVQVTLRWSGLVVGRGEATIDPSPGDEQAVGNVMDMAHVATQIAIGVVRERLADGLTEKEDPKTALAEKFEQVTGYLTVDVQIGHDIEPINLPPAAQLDAATDRFIPGYHGLVLHYDPADGDAKQAWMWPADALSRNMGPEIQIVNILAEIDADPSRVQQPRKGDKAQLYRFKVIHFVRPSRDQPVTQLMRGVEPLPTSGLSAATVDAMTGRLVDHLIRRQRLDGTMTGRYEPTSDRFSPEDTSLRDQAQAAWALGRWLALTHSPGEDADQRTVDAEAAIRRAVDHLARQLLTPLAEPNLTASALTLMAIIDAPVLADRKEVRASLRRDILDMQTEGGAFAIKSKDQVQPLPTAAQAYGLLALVKLYAQTRDDALIGPINRSYGYLAAQKPWGDLNVLPQLAEARRLMRRFDALDTTAAEDDTIRSHLRAVRALMGKQVIRAPEDGPTDVVGGFNFHSDRPGAFPTPDWQSAEALAFFACALRQAEDLQLEAEDVSPIELAYRGALAARFLAQLMFDEPGTFYVRSPQDVLGAVRWSPSRNILEVRPTASALLAVLAYREAVGLKSGGESLPNE